MRIVLPLLLVSCIGTAKADGAFWDQQGGLFTLPGNITFPSANGTVDLIGDATSLPLADGGTNASITASNGGICYSTSAALAVLNGTATASLPLLSGASSAPTWATSTWPLFSRLSSDPIGIVSATPANTTLSVTVSASTTYIVKLFVMFSDSTAADGYRFNFSGGAATVTDMRVDCNVAEAARTAFTQVFETTALVTDITAALNSTAASYMDCQGTITFNAGGTFIVKAGQTGHSTGTLTLRRGSFLRLENMP